MRIPLSVLERGEFRAVAHTGHSYDEHGNEVHGHILAESDWSKNLITSGGLDALLTNASVYITIVAGSGNTSPTISNTTLQSYKGKRTTQSVYSRSVSTSPDAEGYFTITTIYRATFNPGSLGSGAQNISEAGTAMATSGSTTGASPLFSRGLLVDSFGNPLTISLNASTEYLDVYWKHIRYIPAEMTGTQVLSIMGANISHSYTIRPIYLDPNQASSGVNLFSIWWMLSGSSADTVAGLSPQLTDTYYGAPMFGPRFFDGNISAYGVTNAGPSGSYVAYSGSSWTLDTYVTGSWNRKIKLNVIPTEGNLAAGIKSLTLKLNFQGWQVQFNPVLMKNGTPSRVLRLDFTISVANKA